MSSVGVCNMTFNPEMTAPGIKGTISAPQNPANAFLGVTASKYACLKAVRKLTFVMWLIKDLKNVSI